MGRLHVRPKEAVIQTQHAEVSRLSPNLFSADEVAKGIGADLNTVTDLLEVGAINRAVLGGGHFSKNELLRAALVFELVKFGLSPSCAKDVIKEMEYDLQQIWAPRELAESQGFHWDPALWEMVCTSNGGVIAAAVEALRTCRVSGSLSSGLHHARRARGAGFCTFNGLVLAARAALDAGARTVLILDLDAHCGGGTHELIHGDERIWQMDVSIDAFDQYEPLGNNQLEMVHDASRYLATIERKLTRLEREAPRFDICLYNAGMDTFGGCSIGGMQGVTLKVLLNWSGVPTTHLRPTLFAEWALYWTGQIKTGILRLPFGTSRHAPIATEDQARVVAQDLAESRRA